MGTNQGESSTQDNVVKKPFLMPTPENIEGNESGVSDTAGRGAVASGYSAPMGNDGINGTASSENRSAQYKYPSVSDDVGAGANQYE